MVLEADSQTRHAPIAELEGSGYPVEDSSRDSHQSEAGD